MTTAESSRNMRLLAQNDLGGFGNVALYRPKVDSRGLVLFASGDGGWNLGVTAMAHQAAALGYWVAGFSTPQYLKALDDGDGACSDADGMLAGLGASLVRELKLPLDTRPVIIGYSSGATIVYTALLDDRQRQRVKESGQRVWTEMREVLADMRGYDEEFA